MSFGIPYAFRYIATPGGGTIIDGKFYRLANGSIDEIIDFNNSYYISGIFTSVYPHVTGSFVRLTPSGVYNPLPNFKRGFNSNTAQQMKVDGNFAYVGGTFTTFDDTNLQRIAKLDLINGGLDPSFHYTTSGFAGGQPRCLAVDSGLLFATPGTASTTYRGTTVTGYLQRLNSTTGDLDTSIPMNKFNNDINSAIITSGYLYAVGNFTQYSGVPVSGICKINLSTGALDSTFSGGSGFTGNPQTIILDSGTGSLYVGGDMTAYNGTTIARLVKLNAITGARDVTFVTTTGTANSTVQALVVDGSSLYVGGGFTLYNGLSYARLVKVNKATNVIDSSFATSGTKLNGEVRSLILEDSNTLTAFGGFQNYANTKSSGFLRLNTSTAAVLTSIYPGFGAGNLTNRGMALHNGNYIFTGTIPSYGGTLKEGVAKLDKVTFEADPGFNATLVSGVGTVARQRMYTNSGSLFVLGSFQNSVTSGNLARGLAKLDPNTGAVQSFPQPSSTGGLIAAAFTPTWLYIVGGTSLSVSGIATNRYIYRVHLASGIFDLGNTTSGFGFGTADLKEVIYDSSNLYVAGGMTTYRGTAVSGKLIKITEASGTLDTAFNTNIGAGFNNNNIYHTVLESGSIYAVGDFFTFKGSGTNATRVIKLSASTGLIDPTFSTGTGFDGTMNTLRLDDLYLTAYGSHNTTNGFAGQARIGRFDKITGATISGFVTSGSTSAGTMRDGIIIGSGILLTVGNLIGLPVSGGGYPISRSIPIDNVTGALK